MKRKLDGFTVVELLVTIGIIGIVGMLAIPAINSGTISLSSASEELQANLRLARGNAVGRGVHFRVTLDMDSYTVERLHDPDEDGVWSTDTSFPPQTTRLPSSVHVSEGVGTVVEFDTRGLLYPLPEEPLSITLDNAKTNQTKHLKVWASGQVYEV
ncbi:MAG: Tfp pilus assembly protein FimT/FimU [Candidatus Binatia bacterium]